MKIRTAASACLTFGLCTALSGCAWFGQDDAGRGDDQPKVRLWSTTDVKPFSQVKAVDGVGIALATDDRKVFVVGLDPTSGRVLWRRETTPSRVPRGIAMSFATIGSHVALLSPARDGSWRARMQIVSARTGETSAYGSLEGFIRYPAECDDDPKAFCAQVIRGEGKRAVVRTARLTADRSRLVLDPPGEHRFAQSVADGLSVVFEGTQRLLRIDRGREVWSQKPTVMGPRSDLGYGWNVDRDEGLDLFVGTVGREPKNDKQRFRSLADTSTAALRGSDGQPVWSDEGSDYECESTVRSVAIDDKQKSYLRCRSTGTVVWPKGDGERRVEDLDVTLERFDPATGRTTWQVPLGPATGLALRETEGARLLIDDRRQAFRAGAKLTTVDLVSGQTVATPPATVAWCLSDTEFRDPLAPPEDEPSSLVHGGELARPCDVNGKPVDTTPTTWPGDAVAPVRDGVVIAATPEAFVGYGPEGTKAASAASAPTSSVEVWKSSGVEPWRSPLFVPTQLVTR